MSHPLDNPSSESGETMLTMYAILSSEAVKASGGNRGKMAAQCGHAFVRCAVTTAVARLGRWKAYQDGGEKKVVLIATPDQIADMAGSYTFLPTTIVRDAGHTVLAPDTLTAFGIGPLYPEETGDDIKALKVWI